MSYIFLFAAIVAEVLGTTAMKLSEGFTRILPSAAMVLFYLLSLTLLTLSLKRLEVSLAYAIWSGLGTLLVSLIGIWYFGENMSWLKGVSIALIVTGVAGLYLS